MCGIAGWYARSGAVDRRIIAAQCRTIAHRGPDDQGVLVDGDFGFGMRRLSIIDVAGGHQPIRTADGALAIIFNGEIYNHPALRERLIAHGHAFATNSDTETILAGYRQWGNDVWAMLDGMFAVAIWERDARRLTLARDPLGVKPLFVSEQNGGLAFASELKALLPLPGHRFDVDERAVHDFFSFGHVRPNRSIYAQVSTLPPGHLLVMERTGAATIRRYWQPAYRQVEARSERDWIEDFRTRWLATVERHLLADVEVGAFLSGGVDSSAVVAAMSRITQAPVRTFAIGFPVERYNEAPHAEAVARHLGCIHSTRIVELMDARELLPQLQRSYDEPFADASAIPTWYCSELARERVKVVLSGDGGDELFMGYKRHLTEASIAALPGALRRAAGGILALPPSPFARWNRTLQRWQKATGTAGLPDGATRFFAKTQITSAALRARLLSTHYYIRFEPPHAYERLRDEYLPDPGAISADWVEQFAYGDLTINLQSAMLKKVDLASMAHSLEVRVPFLSPPLVDWAMGVPRDMKIRNGTGKHIVREAIRPWLPPEVASRRKQGFQIPLAEWFAGDFGRYARELWEDSGVAQHGVLEPKAVHEVFDEHRRGHSDHSRFLFALSMFSLWHVQRAGETGTSISPASVPAIGTAAAAPSLPSRSGANDNSTIGTSRRRPAMYRAAAIAALVLTGWLMHDIAGPLAPAASASTFIEEAVRSHQATLIRAAVRSRPEVVDYDPAAVARATGIRMPPLPRGWRLLDVQIYPSDDGPSVELAVLGPDAKRFSIVGMKSDTPGGPQPILARGAREHVAFWEEGTLAFAVVGPLDGRLLLSRAKELSDAL